MSSPLNSDPTAYNDASYQFWKAQIMRRSSGRSFNSSPGSRKMSARVAKTINTSHSPHSIQRRRTTASQAARINCRVPQDHAFLLQDPFASNGGSEGQLPTAARPVSWHPGFSAVQNSTLSAEANHAHNRQPLQCSRGMAAAQAHSSSMNAGAPTERCREGGSR